MTKLELIEAIVGKHNEVVNNEIKNGVLFVNCTNLLLDAIREYDNDACDLTHKFLRGRETESFLKSLKKSVLEDLYEMMMEEFQSMKAKEEKELTKGQRYVKDCYTKELGYEEAIQESMKEAKDMGITNREDVYHNYYLLDTPIYPLNSELYDEFCNEGEFDTLEYFIFIAKRIELEKEEEVKELKEELEMWKNILMDSECYNDFAKVRIKEIRQELNGLEEVNTFKTVSYKEEIIDDENLKVTVISACMVKDMSELAKKLSNKFRWVHVYNGSGQYDFSWNKKLGYTQWQPVEVIKKNLMI
ncbi:hypothetical protein P261_02248 [Lachnospiraceae bacterium TWA4]|nr:hypothetical protein P261_02248 [Lachnospiraceae bacterium TWA4]